MVPLISIFITCVTSIVFSQPYLYFPKYTDEKQDDRDINIYRLNLQTGSSEIAIPNAGRVLQLFSNYDQSKLFIQGRGYLDVIELQNNFSRKTIIDRIEWVHNILDVPQTNRIYVSIGTDESYQKTIVLDRFTYDSVGIVKKFMSFHRPFLSKDGSKFFRFLADSAGIFFNIYNTLDGTKLIEYKRCGSIGRFAYNAGFTDGKQGIGISRLRFRKKDEWLTQQYVVCDPEQGNTYGVIPFPLRSEALLSSAAKQVIIEEVEFINDNDPSTPPEYRPGKVFIFDSQSGNLLQKLNLRPQGEILLFDNYPGKLFYLTGTDGSFESTQVSLNVVTPVDAFLDTLIALKHQAFARSQLGDANFVKELDNSLENAKKHLAKEDSLNCAKELVVFQNRVKSGYDKKSTPGSKRFVTEEAYKQLYFNAQYIIDRLPKK